MIFYLIATLILTGLLCLLLWQAYQAKKPRPLLVQQHRSKAIQRHRDSSLIGAYLERSPTPDHYQTLDAHTAWDLHVFALFEQLDTCLTRIGQQLLYAMLHRPALSHQALERWEKLLRHFGSNRALGQKAESLLLRYRKSFGYSFPSLLFSETLPVSRWKTLYSLLGILPIVFTAMGFLHNSFWLLLAGSLALNLYLHYRHKNRLSMYLEAFRQTAALRKLSQGLLPLAPAAEAQAVAAAIKSLKRLNAHHYLGSQEFRMDSDFAGLGWMLSEYLKIFFLAEINAYEQSAGLLNRLKDQVHQLYCFCASADAALAIFYYREKTSFTEPLLHETSNAFLSVQQARHPLVQNCQPNDFSPPQPAAIISGSNMSGKSTFIRTIALNALMAQTIYTVSCSRYEASFFKLRSAIEVNDDLFSGKSYYMEELRLMKTMLEAADKPGPHLFVVDEIFRGTNARERVAAAFAVLRHLNKAGNLVLVSTHDTQLTELLKDQYARYHLKDQISGGAMHFDYTLKAGPLQTTNAIRLLALSGFPPAVVAEAQQHLNGHQEDVASNSGA